jgi:hypothetical protein
MHVTAENLLKHFDYQHLSEDLQKVSQPLHDLAHKFAKSEELAGPELTAGLRKLLEAKDCLVRAALDAKRGWVDTETETAKPDTAGESVWEKPPTGSEA